MKRRIAIIASTLAVLALTGCGGTWYGTGVVIEKHYNPSYESTMIISCGKGACVIPNTVPECYWMKVKASDGEHEGCVRAKVWEDATVGKTITISEGK